MLTVIRNCILTSQTLDMRSRWIPIAVPECIAPSNMTSNVRALWGSEGRGFIPAYHISPASSCQSVRSSHTVLIIMQNSMQTRTGLTCLALSSVSRTNEEKLGAEKKA